MSIPSSPKSHHHYYAYPTRKHEHRPSERDENDAYSGPRESVPVIPMPPMPLFPPPPTIIPVPVNTPAPGFFSQLFTLKGLLYTGAIVAGTVMFSRSAAGQDLVKEVHKGVQNELQKLGQKVQELTSNVSAAVSEKATSTAKAAEKSVPEATPVSTKEVKSIGEDLSKPTQAAKAKPKATKTESRAVQTELPVKPKVTHPEQEIPLTEPDWTSIYRRYDETQGEMGYKISQLHKRTSSLPKSLQKPAVDMKNNTIFYSVINHPDSSDRELIGEVCELAKDGKLSKAAFLRNPKTQQLRNKISDLQHFISHAREQLTEFHAYDKRTSGLRWFWDGLSRKDRTLVQELDQKLDAYASTVKNLYHAVRLPSGAAK